jgi:hypothetical protein
MVGALSLLEVRAGASGMSVSIAMYVKIDQFFSKICGHNPDAL